MLVIPSVHRTENGMIRSCPSWELSVLALSLLTNDKLNDSVSFSLLLKLISLPDKAGFNDG